MDDHLTTAQVLAMMSAARSDWEALLTEIGEARFLEPGVEGDTYEHYRDHIASVRAWLDRVAVY